MKLLAVSDLHLGHAENRDALLHLPAHPDDWLILAGDVGETFGHLELALSVLSSKFGRLIWVPGNHELWSLPGEDGALRGEARYERLVAICRSHGAVTPEDPYPLWCGDGPPTLVVPLFTLYDYSFAPDGHSPAEAVRWAADSGVVCADERYLHPDPHPSRQEWSRRRLELSEKRLASAGDGPKVLVNHFPLRADLAELPRIPRFKIWCGSRRTEDWHRRFSASVVVSGHLHLRSTEHRAGTRFEEVSLGYPSQWNRERGMEAYLRRILP